MIVAWHAVLRPVRDTPIVAWHTVPGKVFWNEPSRRARCDQCVCVDRFDVVANK
jgi:hypothetical protein